MTRSLLLAAVFWAGTSSAQTEEDRLHRIYIHDMPYSVAVEEAHARSTDELLDMLMDPGQARYWPNASKVLGFTGDDGAVEGLIDFIEGNQERGFSAEWSPAMHRGRTSAIMALGYAVNLGGSERAMNYLMASVHAESWNTRNVHWLHGHPKMEALRRELCTTAVLGLALTGHQLAADKLNAIAADDTMNARVQMVAQSALGELDKIIGAGLEAYSQVDEPRN